MRVEPAVLPSSASIPENYPSWQYEVGAKFDAPLIGGRHQIEKIARIRPRIWCAYAASTWWKLGGPRWAPELPIHCDDIAAARQDEHPWRGITGYFAGSLAAAGYKSVSTVSRRITRPASWRTGGLRNTCAIIPRCAAHSCRGRS
jgi:hypothetical protein